MCHKMNPLCAYFVLIVVTLSANYLSAQRKDYKRICYYTNWSQYRTGLGKFTPKNVDPFLCTHIVFAFAKTSGNRLEAVEWNDESTEWSKGMYARINDLKKKNPKLKTLLAIGGWTEGNAPISTMASTNESRDEFVSTTIHYLRTRGFDGLDLDWEYPGSRGGPPEDKENLIHLLKKLRSEFTREARETHKEPLLLAIAVPVGEERINAGYNIAEVNRYVDFINLMAYDFHGAWEAQTGHHSPLFKGKAERWYAAQLNVQWSAAYWRRNGASRDKLVIGIAMYGRGYKLQYPSINGIGAQALVGSNGNSMGPFTKSKGLLAYYEICSRLNGNGVEVWDEERRVPYMYDDSDWVGYENVRSVVEKTKWLMDHGYAGVMIWALDQDDFTGHFCKAGKYPLLTAINKTLKDYTPSAELTTNHLDIHQATDDLLKYEGTTKRIVDSTSLTLTGLTSRHLQPRNNIIDSQPLKPTTTTPPSSSTTTESPATEHLSTTIETTTREKMTPQTTPESSTTATTNSDSYYSTVVTLGSSVNTSDNSDNTSTSGVSNSTFPIDIDLALNLTFENKTTEANTTESNGIFIPSTTEIVQENRSIEMTTTAIVRSNPKIMSIVAPSEIYFSTDIVHKGRTLLQVDLGANEQQGNTGGGQTSGFTSVLNSLFSVLSEFGGFVGNGRRSSNQRNGNGDSVGQRNTEPQRPRNGDSMRTRTVDSARQRSAEPQRQRNGETMPLRNRDAPAQRNDGELQRVRNGLSTRSRNADASRQENVDSPRQRMLTRSRTADSAQPVQRNGEPTARRNGDVFRRRNSDSIRQRNEILRRNNDLLRQRNGNGEILRQRNGNADLLRQRNGNADILRQRNGNGDIIRPRNNDITQRNAQRNNDLIRQRINGVSNPRNQRIPETPSRILQRQPSQTPNRVPPQIGGMNTISPQFDPFQNVEMATIPQNMGPSSAQRGEIAPNLPSLELLDSLVQGPDLRSRDPTRMSERGRGEPNRILNRNSNQITPGTPDISALTDMFMAQDPQNQLLQQEAVQTSITEAMLSPDFLNRANGLGGMRRIVTSDSLQPRDIFENRNITSNSQASQMRETLFSEIRNRQPSLNTNSIDTIDLAFLESQVEEGFARDRAQQIEQSMLSPEILANDVRPNGLNGILPQLGLQALPGQFPSRPAMLGRNSLIPRPNQFQQTSMQIPETNRNTSVAVIPFNNLDRTLQQVVSTGPGFRLRNQTTPLTSIPPNGIDQVPFRRNGPQSIWSGGMANQNIVTRVPQAQPGLPGPLQLARIQDGPRQTRNMLGPLAPIQRNRGIPSITNTFMSSSLRTLPRLGRPLLQAANTNNRLSLNSLFSPMNTITARASTIGSPGPPQRTPKPLSSSAIQTPDEVIQRTNRIGSRSVFSKRTNTTVNIDGSMLKAEPVIPKSEILWKWEV